MTKQKTILDDLIDAGREILEKVDEMLNPEKKRQPARIPIPIRKEIPQPRYNPEDYWS